MARKGIKSSLSDPDNSIDLFDIDRKNDQGEYYCVAPAILRSEVAQYWSDYIKARFSEQTKEIQKDLAYEKRSVHQPLRHGRTF